MVAPITASHRAVGFWKSRVGLSPAGTASLAAVIAVLVFVSLARLRPQMTHENEVDAQQTVRLLADELAPWTARSENHGLVPGLEELTSDAAVRQALADGRFENEGRILKRHGYLFDVVELPPLPAPPPPRAATGVVQAAEPPSATPAPVLGIRAWPWKHGSSGRAVFVATADGRLFRHANQSARWSGPDAGRVVPATWEGWRELRR